MTELYGRRTVGAAVMAATLCGVAIVVAGAMAHAGSSDIEACLPWLTLAVVALTAQLVTAMMLIVSGRSALNRRAR